MNGASFASGEVGKAFSLDGVDDYVDVPDSSAWNFGTGPFSIDVWAKFNQLNPSWEGNTFVAHDEGPFDQAKWIFWHEAGALHFHINSPMTGGMNVVSYPWTPVVGRWYHIAVTRGGDTFTLYLDGAAVSTATNSSAVPSAFTPLTFGRAEREVEGEGANDFGGLLDEVEIFDRTLTAAEVSAIYNSGTAGKCKPGPAISGHGRFGTEGDWGRVDFTLSNEQVTFDRGTRFKFLGDVESVTGQGKEATLTGSGSWNGKSGYAFSVSVVDNAPWGVYKDTIDVVVRDPVGTIVLTSFGPQLLKQGDIAVTPADSG